MSMSKMDVIEVIVKENEGMTKEQAKQTLDAILNVIASEVKKGDKVTIKGFGTFEQRERSKRTGRNPYNGEPITIPASKGIKFKAGKALKEYLNEQ